MAAVKFYFRCLVIFLFILSANGRSHKLSRSLTSHGLSGQASKHSHYNSNSGSGGLSGSSQHSVSYPALSGLSETESASRITRSSYPPSNSGLSGSGQPSVSYPTSPGLSGTGSGSRYPASSYPPPNSSISGSGQPSVSYPASPGLSGSGSSYPLSNSGLSGSGQPSVSYPATPGLSGAGSGSRYPGPSYPPSNSGLSGSGQPSVSYPVSPGLSGTGSGTRYPGSSYPPSNSGLSELGQPSVSYPASPGLSGSGSRNPGSSYPSSPGLSGNSPSTGSGYPHPKITYPVARPTQNAYPTNTHHNTHKEVHHHHTNTHTVVHHHYYEYKPPTMIHYTPAYEKKAVPYPVYTGHDVPSYVYDYRSSGNKYRMLLAGLALYNLGMVSTNPSMYNYHKHYTVRPDEVCKFGVRNEYGSYEEMAIDCRAITNFIWEEQSKPIAMQQVVNQTVLTTNVQTQTLLPNGTLGHPGFGTNTITLSPNGTVLNTMNTIITTTTTVDDPRYLGNAVGVSSGMECYILRFTSYSNMKKTVPCGLLNTYAVKSLNYAVTIKTPWILIIMTLALIIAF